MTTDGVHHPDRARIEVPAAGRAPSIARTGRRHRGVPAAAYLFLLPAVLIIFLVFLVPVALGVWTSFQADGSTLDNARWVGLQNYGALVSDPEFGHAIVVSVLFTAGSVVGAYVVGLAAALLLNHTFPGQPILSAVTIVPWALPYVAAAMIWSWLFDYQYGVFTYVLSLAGLVHGHIGWLTDPNLALWAVTGVQVWKLFPLASVLLLAGLKTISKEQVEAARVDGAGSLNVFRHVTLPGLRPVTIVLLLLLSIWVFGRSFTVIYVMTGGGPVNATQNLVLLTYQEGFQLFHFTRAAALGTVIMCISACFALLYWRFLERAAS